MKFLYSLGIFKSYSSAIWSTSSNLLSNSPAFASYTVPSVPFVSLMVISSFPKLLPFLPYITSVLPMWFLSKLNSPIKSFVSLLYMVPVTLILIGRFAFTTSLKFLYSTGIFKSYSSAIWSTISKLSSNSPAFALYSAPFAPFISLMVISSFPKLLSFLPYIAPVLPMWVLSILSSPINMPVALSRTVPVTVTFSPIIPFIIFLNPMYPSVALKLHASAISNICVKSSSNFPAFALCTFPSTPRISVIAICIFP